MSEKLCLKWNDFQENVNTAFGSLHHNNEFSDVTLDGEDAKLLPAHKIILSAASPFFREVLRQLKTPQPLIFLRGTSAQCVVC